MLVEVKENYPIKNLTSFKIGGDVEKLYFPKTEAEFTYLLKTLKSPLIFGSWSNVLISSEGIKGNVISTSMLNGIEINGTNVEAQCGVKGPMLAQKVTEQGLTGFEFMAGFPGSIGGNIYMNASAHKQAISDYLVGIKVFDLASKEILEIKKEAVNFAYRSSILQKKPFVLLSAKFDLEKESKEKITETIRNNLLFRKAHQPNLAMPNAGSIFKNPEGFSAGRLIDEAGAKNLAIGGAKIWEKHANFIVNSEQKATSSDVLELMLKMHNAVLEKFDIKLEPEVKFFGEKTSREDYICNILYNQK